MSAAAAKRIGVPQFVLFVDGRYHLQAEKQCDPVRVHVEKLGLNVAMWPAIGDWLATHAADIKRVGYDAPRLSVAQRACMFAQTRSAGLQWTSLADSEIDQAISLPGWRVERPIFELPRSVTGVSIAENVATLNKRIGEHLGDPCAKAAFLSCAADDLSYLLNSRGYHLPYVSSHVGFLFVVGDAVALFLPEGFDLCPVQVDSYPALRVIRNDAAALERFLAQFDIEYVCYGFEAVNCALPDAVRRVWPDARHVDHNPVEAMRAAKTPEVLGQFRDAFARSSDAIAEAMRWAKKASTASGTPNSISHA
ncbi:creatinase/Prolidase N-terminal domain protein [Burkholderia thailandensis]|uniref:Creatinase/Prolidase N-terminal domain protein n=1 Tax=Burkholderia thailandensis TaxID=57975 RepID=A0AAW9D680_BURTH|nr:creatinase/Prolidase N-terminal domain protein [Burkholderia thailandensis]